MKYTSIENIKSSKIILGTDYYGELFGEETAFKLIETYLEYGGNHIDTARIYSGGKSETLIGKWLKSHKRSNILVSTKGGHYSPYSAPRLSEKDVRCDLEKSLTALSTDYVDIYWLHRDDISKPVEEIVEYMNKFIKEGKIRVAGCSNWSSIRIDRANSYAREHGLFGFQASQIKYSLAKTNSTYVSEPDLVEMNETEYEFYNKTNIPVFAFASQAKGMFSKLENNAILSEKVRERYVNRGNINCYYKAKKLAEKHSCTVASIMMSYLTSNKDFDVLPIIGGKSPMQIADTMKNSDLVLDNSELKFLINL